MGTGQRSEAANICWGDAENPDDGSGDIKKKKKSLSLKTSCTKMKCLEACLMKRYWFSCRRSKAHEVLESFAYLAAWSIKILSSAWLQPSDGLAWIMVLWTRSVRVYGVTGT